MYFPLIYVLWKSACLTLLSLSYFTFIQCGVLVVCVHPGRGLHVEVRGHLRQSGLFCHVGSRG